MASEIMLVNPRKRRTHKRKSVKKVKRNPMPAGLARYHAAKKAGKAPAKRRKFRRNPISLPSRASILGQVMPAVQGALGATALDVAMGYLPLPAFLGIGTPLYPLAKAAGAVGLGLLANNLSKEVGKNVTQGALTVILHDLVRSQVGAIPGVKLGEYLEGYEGAGYQMGEYLQGIDEDDGIGYVDATTQTGPTY